MSLFRRYSLAVVQCVHVRTSVSNLPAEAHISANKKRRTLWFLQGVGIRNAYNIVAFHIHRFGFTAITSRKAGHYWSLERLYIHFMCRNVVNMVFHGRG